MENPCSKSELDVFRPIDVQVALSSAYKSKYYPLQALGPDSNTIEFSIPATTNEVVDMTSISLYLSGKVTKGDAANTALVATNLVAPANNFLHSMIRHIDVLINGQLVTRTSRDYAYKAMLLKLTQTDMPGRGVSDGQLIMEGFCMDDPGCRNNAVGDNANKGLARRKKLIDLGREFELSGHLCVDLFQCDRALLPGSDISIKIYLNEPKFYLIDTTVVAADKVPSTKVILSSAVLSARRAVVTPSFVNLMKEDVKVSPALYPFTRREVMSVSIPSGSTSLIKENLFQGKLGTRFFFAIVNADQYTGSIITNPYKFQHSNLSEIALMENGNPMTQSALKLNFTDSAKVIDGYSLLLECIGAIVDRALATPVTLEHFADGTTIYCFTRSPDLSHGYHHLPPQQGNLTLHVTFSAATTTARTLICMAEFDSVMAIHDDNNVTTDYTT